MVSRRNFLSICIMMLVILALFQFSLLVRDIGGDHNVNEHLTEPTIGRDDAWDPDSPAAVSEQNLQKVVYIGSRNKQLPEIIRQWGTYTKRQVKQYSSLDSYKPDDNDAPLLVCVAGSEIRTKADVEHLTALTENGQSILLCDLPSPATMRSLPELCSLLGIREIAAEKVDLEGVKLFSGFLLGGERIYQPTTEREEELQDLELTIPWYLLRHGTKTYMVGLLEDEEVENEDLPGILWRSGYGDAQIFAVNGSYMYDQTGLGILSGIVYELQRYELHPVVNAQCLSIVNYPNFALENTDELMDIYARNLRRLQMDLLWPNLIAASSKVNYLMTCFMTPQLDYTDDAELFPGDVNFYLRQFREQTTEAGLALSGLPGTNFREKLNKDLDFYDDAGSTYTYGAAYVNGEDLDGLPRLLRKAPLDHVRTLTGIRESTDPLLSYISNNILYQAVTADGFNHTYSQDLEVRAVETALGYSNILLDMRHIAWPEEDEPHWEVLFESFSSSINTYWKPFSKFAKTTVSKSGENVRSFLALSYEEKHDDDTLSIDIHNRNGDAWFLLRTHSDSITDMTGGSYEELEVGVYLICAEEDHVEITLEPDGRIIYYLS